MFYKFSQAFLSSCAHTEVNLTQSHPNVLHAEAINELASCELIWNRTADKGINEAKQFGCKFFPTLEELAADPRKKRYFREAKGDYG